MTNIEQEQEEAFERSKRAREERKRNEENKKAGTGTFIDIKYSGLEIGRFKQVRFLGGYLDGRTTGTSPKEILFSKILGDDDKKFHCYWPDPKVNGNHILWRMYNKVMAYKWDKDKGDKGERIYYNKDSHPSLFKRMAKNNSDNQYENGWYPKRFIITNIIDRDLNEWHKENKHSAILSKKIGGAGEALFPDPGIPVGLYNNIYDEIVAIYGSYNKYDVVIEKVEGIPYSYRSYHAFKDYEKLVVKFSKDINRFRSFEEFNNRPLTDEEKEYELYDFDKFFHVTDYNKILFKLKHFIGQIDSAFKTHFLEELQDLVAKEKEEKEKNFPSSGKDEVVKNENEVKELVAERSKTQRNESREPFDLEEANGRLNLKLKTELIPEAAKKRILGVNDDGSFAYDLEQGEKVFVCSNETEGCTFKTTKEFTHCPKCGIEY